MGMNHGHDAIWGLVRKYQGDCKYNKKDTKKAGIYKYQEG